MERRRERGRERGRERRTRNSASLPHHRGNLRRKMTSLRHPASHTHNNAGSQWGRFERRATGRAIAHCTAHRFLTALLAMEGYERVTPNFPCTPTASLGLGTGSDVGTRVTRVGEREGRGGGREAEGIDEQSCEVSVERSRPARLCMRAAMRLL